MVGPAGAAASFLMEGITDVTISLNAPSSALPVQDAGSLPEVMQRLMVRSSGVSGFLPVKRLRKEAEELYERAVALEPED
jgi:hypothetical protein